MNISNSTVRERNVNFFLTIKICFLWIRYHISNNPPKVLDRLGFSRCQFRVYCSKAVTITVFRDTCPRTPAFRKYPPPPSRGSNMETESTSKRLLCVPDDRASQRTRKQYKLQFYWGTREVIWVTGWPHVSIRALNERFNSLIHPTRQPGSQDILINSRVFIHNYLEMTHLMTFALNMIWNGIQFWKY
jgi:hypothetical protein